MRFQFIGDHNDEFPVRRMCNELNVSASGYYAWRKRPPSAREMANQEPYKKIKAVWPLSWTCTPAALSVGRCQTA
jgi:putative transposase